MTSELTLGLQIEELVSGGPKNYAYRIMDPVTGIRETVCKVRGKTLNSSASKTINFYVIKGLALRGDDTESHGSHREQN